MEPAHYAGLLRPGGRPSPGSPPRFDPYFGGFGEVMVRDLALYEASIIAAILSAKKVSSGLCITAPGDLVDDFHHVEGLDLLL